MSGRKCGYRKCSNLVVRRANEKSDKYKARKYCCVSCGHKEQRLRKTLGEKKRVVRVKKEMDTPDHSRFQMSHEEEVGQGAAVIRQILHSFNELPKDGSPIRSEVKIYHPGDPEFESIAASVTPIDLIPDSHGIHTLSWT